MCPSPIEDDCMKGQLINFLTLAMVILTPVIVGFGGSYAEYARQLQQIEEKEWVGPLANFIVLECAYQDLSDGGDGHTEWADGGDEMDEGGRLYNFYLEVEFFIGNSDTSIFFSFLFLSFFFFSKHFTTIT